MLMPPPLSPLMKFPLLDTKQSSLRPVLCGQRSLLPTLRADGSTVTGSVSGHRGHLTPRAIRIRGEGASRRRMRFEDEGLALCTRDQNVHLWICHDFSLLFEA